MLENTLEIPLECKEIKPVSPKGNQPWMFIWRTLTSSSPDTEGELPILWPPDVKSWLIGKDTDAGKDWGQEKKGATEDKMVAWHHWLNGHESEKAQGAGDGQGGLACCSSWGRKESDTTERLNWTELKANSVLPRKCTGHSKHALPTTQEKTLHMDIIRWSIPKSDWLYYLPPKKEKLYTVSKNNTGSWLWLRSWTPYCQLQT